MVYETDAYLTIHIRHHITYHTNLVPIQSAEDVQQSVSSDWAQ